MRLSKKPVWKTDSLCIWCKLPFLLSVYINIDICKSSTRFPSRRRSRQRVRGAPYPPGIQMVSAERLQLSPPCPCEVAQHCRQILSYRTPGAARGFLSVKETSWYPCLSLLSLPVPQVHGNIKVLSLASFLQCH